MKIFATFLGAMLFIGAARAGNNAVIVHEWGTFTCLQDENGNAIGGINVNDEPVPNFVRGAESVRRHGLGNFGLPPYFDQIKGWRPADADVTMRLETPVLYFYPPAGVAASAVPPLNVHVDFHGGVLSQYYPFATASGWSPNFPIETRPIGEITSALDWKSVKLGSTAKPVATDDKVWTTPREVSAPVLEVPVPIWNGDGKPATEPQAEHFLFYRGLGHLVSPLSIHSTAGSSSTPFGPFSIEPQDDKATQSVGWIVEIRADGSCAVGRPAPFRIPDKAAMILKGSQFKPEDFNASNLFALESSMHAALVKEGLYDDESTAMLKTWELSYFKSPGLRFFYIVPRAWVDNVLPLTISGAPTQVTRVMIGRIELISGAQEATLARLAAGPAPDLDLLRSQAAAALAKSTLSAKEKEAYERGEKPLSDLGIAIPPAVQDYLSLGRFRDALIVHEQQTHPSVTLAQIIKDYGLAPQ